MSPTPPATAGISARRRRAAVLILTVLASRVEAQIGLPTLPTVPVPVPTPGQIIDRATHELADTQDSFVNTLTEARAAAARALIREHRALIEADPDGAPIVRAELLAYAPNAASLHSATAAGFEIVRRAALGGLDGELVTLRGPPGMSTRRALKQLRRMDRAGDYDYNHIYLPSGTALEAAPTVAGAAPTPAPSADARIGMIDSGVDLTHPALAQSHAEQVGCDGHAIPAAHGTAVASLIAGSAADFRGALPGARLLAVDVYCAEVTGGSTDRVAAAFATVWWDRAMPRWHGWLPPCRPAAYWSSPPSATTARPHRRCIQPPCQASSPSRVSMPVTACCPKRAAAATWSLQPLVPTCARPT